MEKIAYVGNDVHKETISLAVYEEVGQFPIIEKKIPNDRAKVQKFYKKLAGKYRIKACYEASGCGYVMHRWLKDIGVYCEVIAPGLIPSKSSDRVKTDKRDAQKLARLFRAGELTSVHIPEEEEESIRSVTRLREQLAKEVKASKQYIVKFLQARGLGYRDGENWTKKHWQFLRGIQFENEMDRFTFERYVGVLEYKQIELNAVEKKIDEIACGEKYGDKVSRLKSFRGIDTLTATGIVSEIIDFDRFGSARAFMAYVGLVPSENSSGETRRQGKITKCGNSRVRRLLVEAAWHYRHKPWISKTLECRMKDQPVEVKRLSLQCQKRLHGRMYHLLMRGKAKNKATTAVARELAGFIWALMTKRISNDEVLTAA